VSISLVIQSEQRLLVSGGDYYDKTKRLCNANDGSPLQTLGGFVAGWSELSFYPDGSLLEITTSDGIITL
jgi:hypothetical protein